MAQPMRDKRLVLETSLQALADVYRDDTPNLTLIEEAAATPRLFAGDGRAAPRYRFMRRVHSRNGEAYCVISIYLDERVFRMAPRRFRRETVIPVLLDLPRVDIAHAWQTLEIGTADVLVARHLGIHVNAPVAEVRRVCRAKDDTVLYLGEVTYRGDYIHLTMDLKPRMRRARSGATDRSRPRAPAWAVNIHALARRAIGAESGVIHPFDCRSWRNPVTCGIRRFMKA
jgi:GntR family transcriptional regulator